MTNRISAARSMNAYLSALLAASPFFASACADQLNDGKSGETHFLCSTDADCARHFGNDDYLCNTEKYCAPKGDGGTSQGDGGHSGGTATGGATGTGGASGGAGQGGAGGSAGGGGDFAQCKTPPNSTCSAADTCAAVGCPSMQYDEHGCLRPQCATDDDCAADERCAVSVCDAPSTCTVQDGMCQCASLTICGEVPRCNPTSTTGPRGAWVSLDVTFVQSLCDDNGGICRTTWHITPDGHVTGAKEDDTTPDGGAPIDEMLDQGQMFELTGDVNGPDLRIALRNGIPCAMQPASDISLVVTLKLSTQTLMSGEVNGCMGGDNVYARIYNVLSH